MLWINFKSSIFQKVDALIMAKKSRLADNELFFNTWDVKPRVVETLPVDFITCTCDYVMEILHNGICSAAYLGLIRAFPLNSPVGLAPSYD